MASAVSPTSAPRTRRRSAFITRLVVALVVTAIGVVLLSRYLDFPPIGAQGRPFHDALGLFSATAPDGWTVTVGPNASDVHYNGLPVTDEGYTFLDQQKGDMSASVSIEVEAMNTPALRAAMCHQVRFPIRFIDGLPAFAGPTPMEGNTGTSYDFYSANAFFQILVVVPTAPAYYSYGGGTPVVIPTPTVTDPGPANTQAQSIINSISVTDYGPC